MNGHGKTGSAAHGSCYYIVFLFQTDRTACMDRTQEPYGQSFCRSVGAVHFLQPAENPQAGNDCIWPMVNRVGIPGISQEAIKTFLGEGHSHLTRHTSRCHTSRCHTPRSGRGSSPAGRKSRGFGPPGIPENLNVHQTDFKRLAGPAAGII